MNNTSSPNPVNGSLSPNGSPPGERTWQTLLGYSNNQLAVTDPLEMNLLVARQIPSLSDLNISEYKRTCDKYAADLKRGLRGVEHQFLEDPSYWTNDIHFFRLGYLCYFVDEELGIRYREELQGPGHNLYTDPSDLFLNGVLDKREGTCANTAALHVALGWRLRWPVSLAYAAHHLICRYEDGKVAYNIEATRTGEGGFRAPPDEHYLKDYGLPEKARDCGSDLRALKPRELLGAFVALRARHYQDICDDAQAEADYLLARALLPGNRYLHYVQIMASVQSALTLFERNESAHPVGLSKWLRELVAAAPWEVAEFQNRYKEMYDAFKRDEEAVTG